MTTKNKTMLSHIDPGSPMSLVNHHGDVIMMGRYVGLSLKNSKDMIDIKTPENVVQKYELDEVFAVTVIL